MNDSEIRAVETYIQERMRDEGLEDLTDPDLYTEAALVDRPTWRYPHPPASLRYLIGMIEAYDRHLSILDGSLFEKGQAILARYLDEMPSRVIVNPSEELLEFSDIKGPLDLSTIPSLYDERVQLLRFAESIIESYDPNPGPGDDFGRIG